MNIARLLIPLLTALILAHSVHAQYNTMMTRNEGAGVDRHLSPTLSLSSELLDAISDILMLSEEQRTLLSDLRAGADARALRRWTVTNERLRDIAQSVAPGDEKKSLRAEVMDQNREAMQDIESRFFEDLRLVLDAEQDQRWASVGREIRRSRTLGLYATRPDESFDLAAIVRRIIPEANRSEELREVMSQYAIAIETPLIARNALVAEARDLWERSNDLMQSERFTEDDRQENLDRLHAIGPLVRRHAESIEGVNRRFWRSFFNMLDEEDRRLFLSATFEEESEDPAIDPERDLTNSVLMQSRSGRILDHYLGRGESTTGATDPFVASRASIPTPEPLSREQRDALLTIRAELVSDLDAIVQGFRSELSAITRQQPTGRREVFNGLGDPINLGDITIAIVDPDTMMRNRAERENEPEQRENAPSPELLRRLVEIDQRTLKAIREILTIRQRAAVASY